MIRHSNYASILLAVLAILILVRCGNDSPTRPQSLSPVPSRITITPDAPTLTETGQSTRLNATVVDQNDVIITGLNVIWSSSNSLVARVNTEGVVTAQKSGHARITATSGSVVASVNISVVPTTARIVVTPSMVSLANIGQTQQLSAGFRDGKDEIVSGGSVSWTSSDSKLATISPSGVVTALGRGTVQITATSGSLSTSIGVSIMTSDSDKAILIALYNETNGPNWTNNENWLSEAPLDEWHGVTTDTDGRVTVINLDENNVNGSIPSEIGQLDLLGNLSFRDNELTGTIPTELGQLTELSRLDLASNHLTGTIPNSISELINLRILDLQSNQLTGAVPSKLGNLLWYLALGGNELSGPIPSDLGRLSAVRLLNLQKNNLSRAIPSELGQLTSLRSLTLSSNNLSGTIPQELGQLTALTRLHLSSNDGLTGTLPLTLVNLPLEYLYLSDTALCAPLSTEFQTWLSTIREKDVVNCADPDRDALIALFNGTAGTNWTTSTNWLSYEPLDTWHGVTADNLGRVQELKLMNNNLNGSLPSALGGLTELNTLNLAFNSALYGPLPRQMTDLSLHSLILNGTNLCSPVEESFRTWLQEIPNKNVSDCTDLHPDWNAMVAFYFGTDGTNWTTNTNWLSTTPMSEWFGVTTNDAGRVIGLSLESNNINGTVPSGIASLTELTRLDLASNGLLSGPLPREATNLNLVTLNLEGTQLCVPPDIDFQNWLSSIPSSRATTCTDPRPNWDALVALYNATNGPNWTNNENWLSDAPFDQWHGVNAGTDGRVVHLVLGNNNLSGSIPTRLSQLTNLTGLYLSNNELTGTIPVELGQLTNLTGLNLSNNELTGTIPMELGQLTNLTRLWLNSNSLSGTIPSELAQLTNLTYLYLNNNAGLCVPGIPEIQAWLTGIQNKSVLNCSDLDIEAMTALYNATGGPDWSNNDNWLSDSPLGDWHGVTTDTVGRVAVINLVNNNLQGTLPSEIANLANLKSLNLASNLGLNGPLPSELIGSKLESLILDGTGLCAPETTQYQNWLNSIPNQSVSTCVDQDTDALIALVGLYNSTGGSNWADNTNWLSQARLSLWYGVTTDSDDKVTELNLGDNNLSGSLPSSLSKLKDLTTLALSDNGGLSGPLPLSLASISLESLSLDGTSLCAPTDSSSQTWLQGVPDTKGVSACAGVNPDREVLVTLYNVTNGPNWNNNSNWLSVKPMGEWYGVTTDNSGRVTGLSLLGNNLLGTIPPELGQMNMLQILRLGFNELSGPIPPELGNLHNLRNLGIQFCWLSGTIPPELGRLTNLETLHLWGNGVTLTGALPPELGQLSNLRELWLSGNAFTGPIPIELGQLISLEEFDLKWNSITGQIPKEIGQLSQLRKLLLIRNKLSGTLPPELGRLQNLMEINLSRNEISGTLPPELGQLNRLDVLNLANNKLHGQIPAELGRMTSLKELSLAGNKNLTGMLPVELTQIDIETFMLGDTQLCAPANTEFQNWLRSVQNSRDATCAIPVKATAYLTQATQSLDYPVPLVAGEEALLRVFIKADAGMDITMPPVRATFFRNGSVVYTVNIPGKEFTIPDEFDENELSASANVEVPGSVIQPGLELVVEIDPGESFDSEHGIAARIPETGTMSPDIRQLPTFELTVVPFLWAEGPEISVLSVIDGLTPESDLLRPTRDLLPVNDFRLTIHAPVWTSVDPISDSVGSMGPELEAIYAIEGERGYYLGIFRAQGSSGLLGIAQDIPSYLSFQSWIQMSSHTSLDTT